VCAPYSTLNATAGWTFIALRVGDQHATIATASSKKGDRREADRIRRFYAI
jgi:hypothetical protein